VSKKLKLIVTLRTKIIIENNSNKNIQINFYLLSEPVNSFSDINLNQGEIFDGISFEFSRPVSNNTDYTGPRLSFKSDSAVVIFDNQKKLSSYLISDMDVTFCEPKSRNIFRHGNYEGIDNDQFVFEITEEDFNNATPCDGDCD
jgi:hypothetical protein